MRLLADPPIGNPTDPIIREQGERLRQAFPQVDFDDPARTSGELHPVSWGSFALDFCGLVTVPGFTLLCLITVIGRVGVGYGEDQ